MNKKNVPKDIFVQSNTVCTDDDDGGVEVREYEASARGMVKSWFERGV